MKKSIQKIILVSLLVNYTASSVAVTVVAPTPTPAAASSAGESLASGGWIEWVMWGLGIGWTGWTVKKAYDDGKKLSEKLAKIDLNVKQLLWLQKLNKAQSDDDLLDNITPFNNTALNLHNVNTAIAAYNKLRSEEQDVTLARVNLDAKIEEALGKATTQKNSCNLAWWKNLGKPIVPITAMALVYSLNSSWKAIDCKRNRDDYAMACMVSPEIQKVYPTAKHYINSLRTTMAVTTLVQQGAPLAYGCYSLHGSTKQEVAECNHAANNLEWINPAANAQPVLPNIAQEDLTPYMRRNHDSPFLADSRMIDYVNRKLSLEERIKLCEEPDPFANYKYASGYVEERDPSKKYTE